MDYIEKINPVQRLHSSILQINPMLQTLQELERKGIPGRILTTDYNNLRALIERGETKALLVSANG